VREYAMKTTIILSGKVLLAFFMTVALVWETACTEKAPSGSAEKGHEAQKEHAGEDGHGMKKASA
jgi:hypothetical protein